MHNYWKDKKVLVTGHTGFVGSWLTCALGYMGAEVTGFSLPEEPGSLYARIADRLDVRSIYGDLRDLESVRKCLAKCDPDIVFHIAAFGFVKECHADPERAYTTNVDGTLNLLRVVEKSGNVQKVIAASSDKVYHNTDSEAYLFTEDDPLGGSDTYSASKTCEDIIFQSYYGSYLSQRGIVGCIVRPSNILGGGDHNMTRLIPSIYHALGQGKSPEIRNPGALRPWQNILDVVDAYMMLAQRCETGLSIYNVGPLPDGIKSVGEIADYVSSLYGIQSKTAASDATGVREMAHLGLSIDKINDKLGWAPKRTLEETLNEIYEFYETDDGVNTYDLCMNQIKRYYDQGGSYAEME